MPDQAQSNPPRLPPNAFVRSFLTRLRERATEATSSDEAVNSGPWQLLDVGGSTAVVRAYTALGTGDRPEAFFKEYETAALFAAILPGMGRDPLYFAGTEQTSRGFALNTLWGQQGLQPAGFTRTFDAEYAVALHVVEAIARNPLSLSYLIEGAGQSALMVAGRMLWERSRWRA